MRNLLISLLFIPVISFAESPEKPDKDPPVKSSRLKEVSDDVYSKLNSVESRVKALEETSKNNVSRIKASEINIAEIKKQIGDEFTKSLKGLPVAIVNDDQFKEAVAALIATKLAAQEDLIRKLVIRIEQLESK